MARRVRSQAPADAFDRSPEQWRELGAPAFVYDMDAAAEAYSVWAMSAWGGGRDPSDRSIRFYYVGMIWLPQCVRPNFLYHVGAVTDDELALVDAQPWSRWDPPDRCRGPLLRGDADVPSWLERCRRAGRGRRGA